MQSLFLIREIYGITINGQWHKTDGFGWNPFMGSEACDAMGLFDGCAVTIPVKRLSEIPVEPEIVTDRKPTSFTGG